MRRLAFDGSVTRDAFGRTAVALGWLPHDVVQRSDEAPYEEIWVAADDTVVHYIEDELIGVSYLVVRGEREIAVAQDVADGVGTVGAADAAAMVRSATTSADRLRGLAYVAAIAPAERDDELLRALSETLGDADPEVRRGAVFACTYPSWPELDAVLERVSTDDPLPELRQVAAQTLTAIRRRRQEGST